jgi:hypothetical protein
MTYHPSWQLVVVIIAESTLSINVRAAAAVGVTGSHAGPYPNPSGRV